MKYCKNCEWRTGSHTCEYPDPKVCQKYIAEIKTTYGTCYELNSNSECKYYKRKWWKVWIISEDIKEFLLNGGK